MSKEDVIALADVVPLDASDYESVIERMADFSLVSGTIYDALHVHAADKCDAGELLTCNGRGFRRMSPK